MPHPLESIYPRSLKHLSVHLYELLQKRLWLKILLAMFLGLAVGILLSPTTGYLSNSTSILVGNWLALPGRIFLGIIQMIMVPLIFSSIIRGLAASEDMEQLRRLGSRVLLYFLITTSFAISVGIIVSLLIQPGQYIDTTLPNISSGSAYQLGDDDDNVAPFTSEGIPDFILNILPQNPISSMVKEEMLQVVLFSLIIGLALVSLSPPKSKPLLDLLGSVQEVCMTIVRWAMLLAPLAVFGLLAQISMKVGVQAMLGMAVYVGTVLGSLFILLVFYLVVITFIGRRPPLWFLKNVREVQLLAFSTSSSAAVMPISIKTAEEKLKIKPSISQFLIPLGATINMDGTALYQGAATIFLAQVYDVNLSLPSLLLIIVTTVGASIGAPATPGVGIVILSMVLNSVGIPLEGIALIIGVDRILDMSRTAVNVTGDLTASIVMDRWVGSKRTLEESLQAELERDKLREDSGEDVIISES